MISRTRLIEFDSYLNEIYKIEICIKIQNIIILEIRAVL
jgi:hypothetical protein